MFTSRKLLSRETWSFLTNNSQMFCRCQSSVRGSPRPSSKKQNTPTSGVRNFQQPLTFSNASTSPVLTNCLQKKYFSEKKMASVNEEFRHLNYTQLNDITVKGDSIVIDVREKSELDETGMIPGSHHIPLGEVENALLTPSDEFEKLYNFKKPNLDDPLVFSCRSGKRSLVALEKALTHGFINAKHYSGGWLDWEKKSSGAK